VSDDLSGSKPVSSDPAAHLLLEAPAQTSRARAVRVLPALILGAALACHDRLGPFRVSVEFQNPVHFLDRFRILMRIMGGRNNELALCPVQMRTPIRDNKTDVRSRILRDNPRQLRSDYFGLSFFSLLCGAQLRGSVKN
jgi:hypothetical protein